MSSIATVRLVAASVFLVGLAFVQDPGYLVADTKLDLSVDPGGFLARAANLWDPLAAFGQLQNQAYGYLWPMGPFFWAGHQVGLEPWVVQRLWWGLLLVVAFVGAARLTRELGVRGDFPCLLAGFAFALSPRIVSIAGGVSIEAWPSAVAPWVLLPLVVGANRGSPRRAAAMSALAIGMVGGVNAAATAAVLPLGIVWLLTRSPGARRRTMMLWWPVFTFMATCWWLVPLFVMGAHSPPFLDYIESAEITTFPQTLVNAVRGTSAWIPYVEPSWRAGNDLLRHFYHPLNSGLLLMLGIAGLGLRRNPHRFFLAASLTVGVLMVTFGHTGAAQGWFAADAQALLDGALAPLRNVHKFDPVIRLPLVVGLAWAIQAVLDARSGQAPAPGPGVPSWLAVASWRAPVAVVSGLAVLATFVGAVPLVQGRLAPTGATVAVPDYWKETARWLAGVDPDGIALLAPGSSFAGYVWGRTGDEPLQALARTPWAVRNAIPLVPPGNIRMLDAVEDRLARGDGSDGLATYLMRAGVSHLVVRNDLQRGSDVPDPVLTHEAIRDSPGFVRVATFGPQVGGGPTLRRDGQRVLVNGGWQASYPAIEVFQIGTGEVAATASSSPTTVIGGPEDLLSLADLGALGNEPTTLGVDTPVGADLPGQLVLTDGLLARERHFGRIHATTSAVLTGVEPRRSSNPTRDYRLADDGDRWSTTARLTGAKSVTASSSRSDAGTPGGAQPGRHPQAAIDGRRGTSWRSSGDGRAWWRVELREARILPRVRLTAGSLADPRQRLRVVTNVGRSPDFLLGPGSSRSVELDGWVRWLRVEDASSQENAALDLAEVRLPGVRVRRELVTPAVPPRWGSPDLLLLRRLGDAPNACVQVDDEVRCNQRVEEVAPEQPARLKRVVRLPDARSYDVRIDARVDPRQAEDVVQRGRLAQARASSRSFLDVRTSGVAAIDGDPGTTWIADRDDTAPTLALNWVGLRPVRGIRLGLTSSAAARRPTEVRVTWPGDEGEESRRVRLDERGVGRFPPIRTDRLSVRVLESEEAADLGFDTSPLGLPPGISELRLLGNDVFPSYVTDEPLPLTCGSGPSLIVNGVVRRTRAETSAAAVMRGDSASAVPCGTGTVRLRAGVNRVLLPGGRSFWADRVLLGTPTTIGAAPVETLSQGPTGETLGLPGRGRALVGLHRNFNSGWEARSAEGRLRPQVVDGWRQGWWTRGDEEVVTTRFVPNAPYRAGLLVGGLLALGLILLVLLVIRRSRDRGEAVSERRPTTLSLSAVAVAVGGLLTGWVGAGLAVGTAVVVVSANRRMRTGLPWLAGAAVFAGTFVHALRPWGGSAQWAAGLGWPDYFVVVGVVAALLLSGAGLRRRPRSRSRIAGSSTSR